ncbi:MAG: 1-acyl-sn-glycerol-3-phosphate acyltransferase [Oscillospiraceae bacterium]|nr:1-acyl-sn-glycerol-3-phosphate acyltransferase [Oscillospiraceae bacterium]
MHRRQRIWRFLYMLARPFLIRRFALTAEPCKVEGPCLIVANHVTNFDPLLLAMSFPNRPIRFVASEHIFRHGWVSRLLEKLVAPIARRKGAAGADTVRAVLRALKDGELVCIFAEGDATWDGLTHPIFSATGKLARSSGATLMTYRLEGGYLSMPRWSGRLRRGRMRGGAVGVYPPETLKSMKGPEITRLIDRDIFEDAWARQRAEHVAFRARRRAEGIERGFFLCPRCKRIGTIKGAGDRVTCPCGLNLQYTEEGFFEPKEPFDTLAEWDRWQTEALRDMSFPAGEPVFSDATVRGRQLGQDHGEKDLGSDTLVQEPDALCWGSLRFPLEDIRSMAMVKANILLLTVGDSYYEFRTGKACCLRKYLSFWQTHGAKDEE